MRVAREVGVAVREVGNLFQWQVFIHFGDKEGVKERPVDNFKMSRSYCATKII